MKQNGQHEAFSGYGGIEDPELHCLAETGKAWSLTANRWLREVDGFAQNALDPGAPNCVLVSITRVLSYYAGKGWAKIPLEPEQIYPVVREIGIRHGYDPKKSGLLRDLFVYTPFVIDDMVTEAWQTYGYVTGRGKNRYFRQLDTIRHDIDAGNPLLMSMSFGDYPSHTVTVTGYSTYEHLGCRPRHYIRIFDGWSSQVRHVFWERLRSIPKNVTRFLPPGERQG